MELIPIRSYFHKHEAEMAKGLLEDQGIACILQSDDVGGFRPHLTLSTGNNRILVKKEEASQAKEILDAFFSEG